jgi:Tfp pilus assembly protein PilF
MKDIKDMRRRLRFALDSSMIGWRVAAPHGRAWLLACLLAAIGGCKAPFWQRPWRTEDQPLAKVPITTRFQQNELSPRQAAEACIATAEELETAGHLREAVSLYEKGRQHDPEAIDYSRRLAVLYDRLDLPVKARPEYRAAIKCSPDNADTLNDYGYFLYRQGELIEAESQLRRALELAANHERVWTNLGIVLAHQGRYGEAFEAFTRVVGPAAAHSNVGAILAKQGQVEQAQRAFRQALALNPELRQPQVFLAYFTQPTTPSDSKSASAVVPAGFIQR